MAIVYITTNNKNGMRYLGKKVKDRPSYLGSGLRLQNAIRVYGKENFTKKILCVVEKDEAARIEKLLSFRWNVFDDRDFWYNLKPGGSGGSVSGRIGAPCSQSTKLKISIENKGRKRTYAQRRKISEAMRGKVGRKPTAETKEKLRISKLGNSWNKGIPKTEKHKKNLSLARKKYLKEKLTWEHGDHIVADARRMG